MSDPIVFVSHFRLKQGKLEGLRQLATDATARLEAEKPDTLVFLSYLNADATRASFVHAFADAESMDRHFEGADSRSRAAYEFLEPTGWEIYGSPSEGAVNTLRTAASAAGVSLTVEPNYIGGFLRVQPR
jgi:hypothetical protein